MSQTGMSNILGTRQELRCDEEFVIPIPLLTAVSGRTLTVDNATSGQGGLYEMGITTNMLAGQEIWVLDTHAGSTLAGSVFHVVSNTSLLAGTDTITLEEIVEGTSRWAEIPASLATTDRLVVSMRGIRPGRPDITVLTATNAAGTLLGFHPTATAAGHFERGNLATMFGVVDDSDLPDPVHDVEELFSHSSSSLPRRHVAVYNATNYDNSWPFSCVWGRYLYGVMGKVVDNASAFAAVPFSQALLTNAYPGEYVIEVGALTNLTIGDYIEIGNHGGVALTGTNSEIRKVVNFAQMSALHIFVSLDKPLRRLHVVGDTATEIHANCFERAFTTANYVKHTLSVDNVMPYHTFGVKKKGLFDDVTMQDWTLTYPGHVFTDFSWKTEPEKTVSIDLSSKGLYAELDEPGYVMSAISRTYMYDASGTALQSVHFNRGYITIAGVRWHQNEGLTIGLTRNAEQKRTHTYIEKSAGVQGDGLKGGREPWLSVPNRVNMTLAMTLPLHNKQLWNLIRQRSKFDVIQVFEMQRSSAFTESWTWTISNCEISEGKVRLPSTATENQELSTLPDNVGLAIQDKTPYY